MIFDCDLKDSIVCKLKLFFILHLFFALGLFFGKMFADVKVETEQMETSCIVITLPSDIDDINNQIKEAIPEPFVVKKNNI